MKVGLAWQFSAFWVSLKDFTLMGWKWPNSKTTNRTTEHFQKQWKVNSPSDFGDKGKRVLFRNYLKSWRGVAAFKENFFQCCKRQRCPSGVQFRELNNFRFWVTLKLSGVPCLEGVVSSAFHRLTCKCAFFMKSGFAFELYLVKMQVQCALHSPPDRQIPPDI